MYRVLFYIWYILFVINTTMKKKGVQMKKDYLLTL